MPTVGSTRPVITSYSIHYTKLYEPAVGVTVTVGVRVSVGVAVTVLVGVRVTRITSYNVCYTKLLRAGWKNSTTDTCGRPSALGFSALSTICSCDLMLNGRNNFV